jgi:hypothetical protein
MLPAVQIAWAPGDNLIRRVQELCRHRPGHGAGVAGGVRRRDPPGEWRRAPQAGEGRADRRGPTLRVHSRKAAASRSCGDVHPSPAAGRQEDVMQVHIPRVPFASAVAFLRPKGHSGDVLQSDRSPVMALFTPSTGQEVFSDLIVKGTRLTGTGNLARRPCHAGMGLGSLLHHRRQVIPALDPVRRGHGTLAARVQGTFTGSADAGGTGSCVIGAAVHA